MLEAHVEEEEEEGPEWLAQPGSINAELRLSAAQVPAE